jgi:hypothetical protein
MQKNKKKFVIDEDIVKEVSKALQAFIEHIDSDCASSGCMCDLRRDVCSQRIRNVLHNFDSCLHLANYHKKEERKELRYLEERILKTIASDSSKPDHISLCYSFCSPNKEGIDVNKIDKAIVARWGLTTLAYIKKEAKTVDTHE